MERSIKRCQVHNQLTRTFCKSCRRMTCPRCKGCEKHEEQGFEELIEGYKQFLQPWQFNNHVTSAKTVSKAIETAIAHNTGAIPAIETQVEEINKTISNFKEGSTADLKLIEESIQHLRETQEKAFTSALKEATEAAIFALDIDEAIEAEEYEHHKKLEEQINVITMHKRQITGLKMKLEWLNTITKAGKDKMNDEVWLALSLCFANGTIAPTPFKLTHSASGYKAFGSVCEVFDIEKVKTQGMVEVGGGLKVSTPITVERKLKGGEYMFSSLSHKGVLAVYYCESGHKYQLTDLMNERQIKIEVDDVTHTGFYDDSIVTLTYHELLGVCSVEEMFLKKDMSVLKSVGDVKVRPFADVTLLHSTRVLVVKSTSHDLYEFNVDTNTIQKIEKSEYTFPLASLTGINVEENGAFKEIQSRRYVNQRTVSVTASSVLGSHPGGLLCSFIPSTSDPTDPEKGVRIYHDGIFYTKTSEKARLTTPFKYQDYQSIVRLYQDIFLVYDADTKKWCLVKILVP